MEAVLVYGATGTTGRLVCRALERTGRPYAVAGRDRDALGSLSGRLASRPEIRVADARDAGAIRQALGGMRAVINTVGPFGRLGMPVVTAAVDLGVHYVDTTGEQHFAMQVYEQLHRRAVSTGATVITGAAFRSTFSCLGAALLHERSGPLLTMSSYYLVDAWRPTLGTARSALAMLSEHWLAFRDGKLVELPASASPRKVRFPGEPADYRAVATPGGDAVMLPLDIPPLQSACCHSLQPRARARLLALLASFQPRLRTAMTPGRIAALDRVVSRVMRGPNERERGAAQWKVFVHGQTPSGSHVFVASGSDVYAISGEVAAHTAVQLADGHARDSGVMTTGKALPAVGFLDAMKPCGVKWELR